MYEITTSDEHWVGSVSPRDHRTLIQEEHCPGAGFGDPSLRRFQEGSWPKAASWFMPCGQREVGSSCLEITVLNRRNFGKKR